MSLIEDGVSQMDFYVEADASYHYDLDNSYASFEDAKFIKNNDQYSFQVVQTGKDKIVVKIELDVKAKMIAEFSLSVWDSIDKDYVSMGSTSSEQDKEFQAAALITFIGDFNDDITLQHLEVIETPNSFDFGEIDPHYEDYEE